MSQDGRRALLAAKDVPVIDTFQFAGPFLVPATVSFTVKWEATGTPEELGSGKAVPPTDPAADRKSTRLNSSHANTSYAVFCLKKKKKSTHSRSHTSTSASTFSASPANSSMIRIRVTPTRSLASC